MDSAIVIKSASVAASNIRMVTATAEAARTCRWFSLASPDRGRMAVHSTGSPFTSRRPDSTVRPIRGYAGHTNSPRIGMHGSPRGKRSCYLATHRPAHRRIDFQKDPIDARAHQRAQARRPYIFSATSLPSARQSVVMAMTSRRVWSPRVRVGSPESRSPSKSQERAPAALGKLDGRVAGARQIIGNKPQHAHHLSPVAWATLPA